MSYCRWSSDNWKSDVYCYESDEGYTTMVAGNRIVGEAPPVDWSVPFSAFVEHYNAQDTFLQACEREDIQLPHAGEIFYDATLEEFRARLVSLKALGYYVPGYVFDDVDAEIAERKV